jgi:hypothetical protein
VVRASSSHTTTTVGSRKVNSPSGTFGMYAPNRGSSTESVMENSFWIGGVLIGLWLLITMASDL